MVAVSDRLLEDALKALGAQDCGPIGAVGGQKAVRRVSVDGRDSVLKVIALAPTAPDALKRAEREVELLRSLSSDYVVSVESELVELGEPPIGAAWLEEFLDGVDLSSRVGSSQWDWVSVRAMGIAVANGLSLAHEVGVVHRDLSPNNIRCLSRGGYVLMDFGFARHTLLSGVTIAGQPGTPGFCSPEHLNSYSGSPMPASDVFCVGILMYFAATSALPIPYSGDVDEYVRALQAMRIRPVGDLRGDVPGDLAQIITRCLHPQPGRRYRNGARLVDALEAVTSL